MTKILIILALFSLTSCNKITGNLVVHKYLKYKSTKGDSYIPTGNYRTQLKIYKNKKFIFKVINNGIVHKIKVPAATDIINLNVDNIHKYYTKYCEEQFCDQGNVITLQEYDYNSENINQYFDLRGKLTVVQTKIDEVQALEACNIVPNLNECRDYRHDYNSLRHRSSHSMCHGVPGRRSVRYNLYNYQLNTVLNFINDNLKSASFISNRSSIYKNYTYQGPCTLKNEQY